MSEIIEAGASTLHRIAIPSGEGSAVRGKMQIPRFARVDNLDVVRDLCTARTSPVTYSGTCHWLLSLFSIHPEGIIECSVRWRPPM